MQTYFGIIHTTQCCGIRELDGIAGLNPRDILYTMGRAFREGRNRTVSPHYVFSDNSIGLEVNHYGDALKQFIEDNNFGTVIETVSARNPNSGNILKAFIWTADDDARGRVVSWSIEEEARSEEQRIGLLNENLAVYNLKVGDAVCFKGVSPNAFTGRAKIILSGDSSRYITLDLKDSRGQHRISLGELQYLVKARNY